MTQGRWKQAGYRNVEAKRARLAKCRARLAAMREAEEAKAKAEKEAK